MRPSPNHPTTQVINGPRLYCAEGLALGAIVKLSEAAFRHVAALRLSEGDVVTLFAGDGDEYPAELIELSKRAAVCKIIERRAVDRESPVAITLVQGVCAADRMDLLVQKGTELGVHAIQPVITSRTVIRLSHERQERRHQHWINVALAACEQCGRNRIPTIDPTLKLEDWIATGPTAEAKIILSPQGSTRLTEMPRSASAIVAIGPEGGLTQDEHALLMSRGFTPVRFGPRIMRTETAPLAVIAALQALWGDC
jgi:16S rRNA (uracil1498-N3)-methyltransferase